VIHARGARIRAQGAPGYTHKEQAHKQGGRLTGNFIPKRVILLPNPNGFDIFFLFSISNNNNASSAVDINLAFNWLSPHTHTCHMFASSCTQTAQPLLPSTLSTQHPNQSLELTTHYKPYAATGTSYRRLHSTGGEAPSSTGIIVDGLSGGVRKVDLELVGVIFSAD
jgi:hypothetical protein